MSREPEQASTAGREQPERCPECGSTNRAERFHIKRLEAELAEARKERDHANKIKWAEKQILIKEIEDHAATKAELSRLKESAERDKLHNEVVRRAISSPKEQP